MENPFKRLFGGKQKESLDEVIIGESAEMGAEITDAEQRAKSQEDPNRRRELAEEFESVWTGIVDSFIDGLPMDDGAKSSFRGDLEEYKEKLLLEFLSRPGATKHNVKDLILQSMKDELVRFKQGEEKRMAA